VGPKFNLNNYYEQHNISLLAGCPALVSIVGVEPTNSYNYGLPA